MWAVPYTQLCETKTWWDHLWTTVRFQKLRGVWKPMQGLGRRSHILNSETTLWGNHHSINTLFHWEEFENLCWFYTKKCHKLKSAKEKCGEIVFRLTSGFRKWKLFENLCGAYRVRAICEITLWWKRLANNIYLISEIEKCLKTHAGPRWKGKYPQIWNTVR